MDARTDGPPQIRAPSPSHRGIISRTQLRSLARTHATQTQAQSKSISRFGGKAYAGLTPPNLRFTIYIYICIYIYIGGWGCLTGKSISIALAFALRACVRAKLRVRDDSAVARVGLMDFRGGPSVRPAGAVPGYFLCFCLGSL